MSRPPLPDPPEGRLPAEARRGIELAWLAILHERHPGVRWVIAAHPPMPRPPEDRDKPR